VGFEGGLSQPMAYIYYDLWLQFHDKLPSNSTIIASNVIRFSFINGIDLKNKNSITFKDKNI